VDIKEPSIREAKTIVFPERHDCFILGDLRNGVHHTRSFTTVIVNPLYADQGYYQQVDGKILKLHLDGSVQALVIQCWRSVAPGGRLVLWCYDGHVAEIAAQMDEFRTTLAATSLPFRELVSGPVSFWISDRSV
jgi:23S rRNA A1618 N6-methylase RlmF